MQFRIEGWLALGALTMAALAPQGAQAAGKSATFDVTAVHSGPGGQITITSRVWVTPTQARADVTYPAGKGKVQFLVTNGHFYQMKPDAKKGVREPLPPEMRKSKDNFNLLLGKLAFDAGDILKVAKKQRTEKLAGYTCDVLSKSVSEGGMSRSITVWVPQKMQPQIPLKAVMADKMTKPGAQLERTVTVTLSSVKVNVPIARTVFAVPAGYQIAEAPKPGPKSAKGAAPAKKSK